MTCVQANRIAELESQVTELRGQVAELTEDQIRIDALAEAHNWEPSRGRCFHVVAVGTQETIREAMDRQYRGRG